MYMSICSTCGSVLIVLWCLKRGKRSGELVTDRRNTNGRDRCVHSRTLMYGVFMCSSNDWCTRLVTNHDQHENPVLTCEIQRRSHPWLKRPACPLVMSQNWGVRQHHGENALGGYNWNPLTLQKWLQIFEGVISRHCVQMVVQYRHSGPWSLDGSGRCSGQALGIP